MCNEVEYNKVIKKLISIEDKIVDIDKIAKMLDIWVKDNNYKPISAMNILNSKIQEVLQVIER